MRTNGLLLKYYKNAILTWHGCVRDSDWLRREKLLCKTPHNIPSSILSLTMLLRKKKTSSNSLDFCY